MRPSDVSLFERALEVDNFFKARGDALHSLFGRFNARLPGDTSILGEVDHGSLDTDKSSLDGYPVSLGHECLQLTGLP